MATDAQVGSGSQGRRSPKEEFCEKIVSHSAVVGVVGLGYVGLPFAVEKAKVGFPVIGIEENPARAERVNRGER